jgi:hypothetical protein
MQHKRGHVITMYEGMYSSSLWRSVPVRSPRIKIVCPSSLLSSSSLSSSSVCYPVKTTGTRVPYENGRMQCACRVD